MSLLGFQRALSALAASPELVKAVRREGEGVLAEFDLTPLERRRAASTAQQGGMIINCGLHRTNRIASTLAMLPLSIFVIGGEIRRVADLFWEEYPNPDFTTRRELHRFGRWVRQALDEDILVSPYLREVIDFELHCYDLGMAPRQRLAAAVAEAEARFPDGPLAPHPLARLARFRHDPGELIPRLREKRPLPYEGVPEGEFYLLVDFRDGVMLNMVPLDLEQGRALAAVEEGAADQVDADTLAALHAEGFLVRAAPVSADSAPAHAPAFATAP